MPTRRLPPAITAPADRAGLDGADAGRGDAATGRAAAPVAVEVALELVTMSTVVGLHRLFVDGSYRAPLLAQALAAHAVMAMLRRRDVGLVPAAAVTLAVAHHLDIRQLRSPRRRHHRRPDHGSGSGGGVGVVG